MSDLHLEERNRFNAVRICVCCGREFWARGNWEEYCPICQENYEYAPEYDAEKVITEKEPESIASFKRWFKSGIKRLFYW